MAEFGKHWHGLPSEVKEFLWTIEQTVIAGTGAGATAELRLLIEIQGLLRRAGVAQGSRALSMNKEYLALLLGEAPTKELQINDGIQSQWRW